MRRWFVLFFAAASGYVSLTQEMIWMRLVGYVTGGEPTVFAHVLGFFLVGVAGGALFAEQFCVRHPGPSPAAPARGESRLIARLLLASALFYYLSIAAVAQLFRLSHPLGMAGLYTAVTVASFLLGGVFTLLCDMAQSASENAGITVSRIYLANIVGSTLGPVLTGFFLMQRFGIDRIILLVSLATALLGLLAGAFERLSHSPPDRPASPRRPVLAGGLALSAAAAFCLHGEIYPNLLQHFRPGDSPFAYKSLVENRSGIIAVTPGRESGDPDILWGGGVYDGRFTTDPVADTNGIRRFFLLAAIHPAPRDVLMIGLATGSAARVAADYVPVRHLTVVEINAGYPQLIQQYGEHASVLTDPKIQIEIDDGRRWLQRHADAKFDVMFQNTIWHWRTEATNLLSADFFALCKSRLNPNGVLLVNTTYSQDVAYTAAQVFRHVAWYQHNIVATDSDVPLHLPPAEVYQRLGDFRYEGRSRFASPDPARQSALDETRRTLASTPLTDVAQDLRARTDLNLITDDNMVPEFKRQWSQDSNDQVVLSSGKWFDLHRTWLSIFWSSRFR